MFSSLACVASEKVTHLSRFFIVTPKEVLHFPFITSKKKQVTKFTFTLFILRKKLWKQGFFLYIFVHFSTLQHTDFIPFLMLHDRWFYSFFRAQRSNKKTIKTSKNLYKNDPFFTYYFHLQEDQKSTSFTPWLSLIFPLIFLLFYPFWDVLKRLYFHPLIYLWTTFKTTQNPTKTPVISP